MGLGDPLYAADEFKLSFHLKILQFR